MSATLETAHGFFLLPRQTPRHPHATTLLRGVNLSSTSKFPPYPASLTSSRSENRGQAGSSREDRDAKRLHDLGRRTDIDYSEGVWDEAEKGGREGWFVGRPLAEESADMHFQRLRAWGYTVIRWIVPWEALEHSGPGKYDEEFIQYTVKLLRKAKAYGFRVFISPHQDVFSRFTGGCGAPYWVIEACGINPRRVHQTGSAVLHSQWKTEGWGGEEGLRAAADGKLEDFPDMIWNSNTGRIAVRHCFTMFWAGEVFAPKYKIDGEPIGPWLRRHFNEAYSHLAQRIAEAGDLIDECVIGWDTMNEPDPGFVGIPDLNEFPPTQEFRKGPSATPIQAFQLAVGKPVSDIEDADFGSLGLKKKGTITITPPNGEGLWLTAKEAKEAQGRWGWKSDGWKWGEKGGCIWAQHGVWDPETGKSANKSYYLQKTKGGEHDFLVDYWKPHYFSYLESIRKHHPRAITFIGPPVFQQPPNIEAEVLQDRAALAPHYYDALTMLGKRRHVFNADAVGIQRGTTSLLKAFNLGDTSIRKSMRDQLGELASDAGKTHSIAGEEDHQTYPTIIGEMGTPWDMKGENSLLGLAKGKGDRKNYSEPIKAMDQILFACDGPNPLSYTLWDYEPLNRHEHGDGWNGEDLSLFSYDEVEGDLDLKAENPKDLESLISLGSRGIESWCRPYPIEVMGRIEKFEYTMSSNVFELEINIPALKDDVLVDEKYRQRTGSDLEGQTRIYIPFIHYRTKESLKELIKERKDGSKKRFIGQPGEGKINEWREGEGPTVVDLSIEKISEGELSIIGQCGVWKYPLLWDKQRTIKLKFKPWSD